MSSPDVDWQEFEADFQDRNFLELVLACMETIIEIVSHTKMLHDFDVYQAALTDYDYTRYKAGTQALGYDRKHADIRQFFPNTGGGGRKTDDPATDITT